MKIIKYELCIVILIVVFLISGCKKAPKSIYGKMTLALKNISDTAQEMNNPNEVLKQYDKMKKQIIKFNEYAKEFSSMNSSMWVKIKNEFPDEYKDFVKYVKELNKNKPGGLIANLKKIGKMNLEGQKLRNAFFEVMYQNFMKRYGSVPGNPSN